MSKKPRNQKPADTDQGNRQTRIEAASVATSDASSRWTTVGLQQANTMGGGEAPIPKNGKFRVFVLMARTKEGTTSQGAGHGAPGR